MDDNLLQKINKYIRKIDFANRPLTFLLEQRLFKKKLHHAYKMGYMPSRGDEQYSEFQICNCVGHALFNLNNELLENIFHGIKQPYFMCLEDFIPIDPNYIKPHQAPKYLEDAVMGIVKNVGLDIKQCNQSAITKHNQWKVALYKDVKPANFDNWDGRYILDYHMILQRDNFNWEHKLGWGNEVQIIESPQPPRQIFDYTYVNSYIITNPYIKEASSKNILHNPADESEI